MKNGLIDLRPFFLLKIFIFFLDFREFFNKSSQLV